MCVVYRKWAIINIETIMARQPTKRYRRILLDNKSSKVLTDFKSVERDHRTATEVA